VAAAEASRKVSCATCGDTFQLSARNIRAARQAGRPIRCRRCRGHSTTRRVREADRRFWLERFTLDEIQELAQAIWGQDRTPSPPS
jgi:DNA-directed RNA polymerase subunit RPC12/RpoP